MRIEVANRRDRVTAAVGVAALEALLGYALITGLQVVRGVPAPDVLRILNLAPPTPPPPVAAAPIAGIGAAPSAGAAPIAGPGTGAGGQGNGTGSGAGGNGTGSGGGLGRGTAPRQIHGRIKDRDYPESARASGAQGTVWVRYTVTVDGRAINCRVLRSSGNGAIDETTCRLIQGRFRYKPAKDEHGRPVQADMYEKHEFYMREGDAPPDDEDPGPD